MRLLRAIGILLVGAAILIALALYVASFGDGPLGPFPGGALRSGLVEAEPVSDWGFARSEETIELQLLSEERSRTTWILVHGGEAFIPCSLGFPPGKKWHRDAIEDGRGVVRIDGRRYPVTLGRIPEGDLHQKLSELGHAKYGEGPASDSGVWFFRLTSRRP